MDKETEFYKSFVMAAAKEFGWKLTYDKSDKCLLGFRNAGSRCFMDVYLRSKRFVTCLQHPRNGITLLERSNIAVSEIRKIFEDPRTHIGKGKRIV